MIWIQHFQLAFRTLHGKTGTKQAWIKHIANQMRSATISEGQVRGHTTIHLWGEETRFRALDGWLRFREITDQADRIATAVHQRATRKLIVEADVFWRGKQKAELGVEVLEVGDVDVVVVEVDEVEVEDVDVDDVDVEDFVLRPYA